jgi:hypothetical protein
MELYPNLQIFHNRVPVELIEMIRENEKGQLWLVKPLFVEKPNETRVFRPSDRYSKLHTQRAI